MPPQMKIKTIYVVLCSAKQPSAKDTKDDSGETGKISNKMDSIVTRGSIDMNTSLEICNEGIIAKPGIDGENVKEGQEGQRQNKVYERKIGETSNGNVDTDDGNEHDLYLDIHQRYMNTMGNV